MNRKSLPAKTVEQYESLYPVFYDGELHHFCYTLFEYQGEEVVIMVDQSESNLFKQFVRLYFQRNNQYNPINNQINDKAINFQKS